MDDFELIKELPKPMKLSSLYFNGKYKLMASIYNLVHSYPTDMAEFTTSPIYLLGKKFRDDSYTPRNDVDREVESFTDLTKPSTDNNQNKDSSKLFQKQYFREFLLDFRSIFWFCYRKEFPPLEPFNITTDIGWGCMLRTAQMLLANAIKRHLLGDNWRINDKDVTQSYSNYRQIVRWFADMPQHGCPYSIHNLVYRSRIMDHLNGEDIATNNKIGEWYSPNRVCQILKHIVTKHRPENLSIYVAKEGLICRDRVEELCEAEDGNFQPLIITVPLRLGLEFINKEYIPVLKYIFRLPQVIGIIGGRPKQSLYFVGYQDDQVIYLDPHIVRPTVKPEQDFTIEDHHSDNPHTMQFSKMDPSLAIGFYCRDRLDFESLCIEIEQMGKLYDPFLSVVDLDPHHVDDLREEENTEEKEIFVF